MRSGATSVAIVLAVATSIGAIAEPNQFAPSVFSNRHESEFGNFSHWSAVIQRTENRIEIEYAVCNFHKTSGLIYKWMGPNIAVGDGGTLPIGKCHILNRDVASITHDRDAFIAFTQAQRRHPAAAHLSNLSVPIPESILPRFLMHRLRSFYGPESSTAQPTVADLLMSQYRSDNFLHHHISWDPPTVTIAFGLAALGGASPNEVSQQVNAFGYNAQLTTLKTALAQSSWSAIPEDRLSEPVILLTKAAAATPTLNLKLTAPSKLSFISSSHITIIDNETKKVVTDFEISAFSPG